ncbi:hypothetical protein HY949_03480 [Candidatus Gottesmanbacteria bacterium]|nr:hypothetical protein [Candidatus Gottesmanbacteria bacterium]
MATRKIAKKKATAKKQASLDMVTPPMLNTETMTPKPKFNTKVLYLVVGLLALSALLLANKSLLVAAVVDGRPVWSWELNRILVDRYGKQTLEGMISEKLIEGEAGKAGVVMNPADVKAREEEIVKGLGGGMSLYEILKIQGLSKDEFDRQITLQLTVQKLLGKDLTITEGDIDNYIATNRATLAATEAASLRMEAKQAILDAHIGEKLQPWFNELKTKAKILRFL